MADLSAETGRPSPERRRAHRAAGAVIGAVGALGVTASAYLDWYAGRMPTQIPLRRLFDIEVFETATSYWNSMAAPIAIVGVLGVVGALLRSRLLIGIAGALGVCTLVAWILMQAIDLSPDDLRAGDYEVGLWVCVASLVVLFIGIGVMGRPDADEPPQLGDPAALEETRRPSEV